MNTAITKPARAAHNCDRIIGQWVRALPVVEWLREEGFSVLSVFCNSDRAAAHIQICSDDGASCIEQTYGARVSSISIKSRSGATGVHYTWDHGGCSISWVQIGGAS